MRASDVSGCVAVQARQLAVETDWLLGLAGSWPAIVGVVGWVDLRAAGLADQLEQWRDQPLLKGFRHVVIDEDDPDFLEHSDVTAGIAELGRHGYSYDLLVLPHQLPGAARLAQRFPGQQFVLDHAGLPDIRGGGHAQWAESLAALASLDNVTMKLSALDFRADWDSWAAADLAPYLDSAFELFGSSRLMMASNWPVCTLSSTYAGTLAVVAEYVSRLTASEQSDVRFATARRTYRIEGALA
jgi:L-fuconolactonase